MKNIMKEAHNLTKKIIRKGDSYRATFRMCLSFVHSQIKKGVAKMLELKGTEKQVKYANDIKESISKNMTEAIDAIETIQEEIMQVAGKRQRRADKIANQLKEEMEIINTITEAKVIIENYKKIFKLDVNELMNTCISDLK